MTGDGHRGVRLLTAVVVSVLFAGSLLAVNRARTGTGRDAADDGPVAIEDGAATPGPEDSPSERSPAPSPAPDTTTRLLEDPEAAEAAGGEAVLAAGREAARGEWSSLGAGGWQDGTERPVYVGRVTLGPDRDRVDADLVVAFRADRPMDEVVLRLLPAADALGVARTGLDVVVRRDGTPAPREVDGVGARLLVTLDPPVTAGDAVLLRVTLGYDVLDRATITDDGGPAGFGLLAWNPEATFLGHWLPLLTIPGNDGAMIPWGDVGAFPVAVWSLVVEHAGVLVTGGAEGDCPAPADGCTWVRGTLLRDASAVAFDADAVQVTAAADASAVHTRVTSPAGSSLALANASVLTESVDALGFFTGLFGALGWPDVDVVAAPMSSGAAGMEFPGLAVIDTDVWADLDGGFGTFVLVHEVAHQWFHALVGNGSLSDPVVDESLAQYLSYLWWADEYGEQAAARFASAYFTTRYARARGQGLVDEPPAQPLAEFDGDDAYGPLVYARAPLGWVEAERAAGRDTVTAFLADLVTRHGLGFVTDEQVVAEARLADPTLGDVLARWWEDPGPQQEGGG